VIEPQDRPELAEEATTPDQQSYGQILKSSALIGFSTVDNLAIGIVRTKAMAMWLGPAGFGLMGLYGSIADLAQSIAGMGINASGVRQIAEAIGTGDTEQTARAAVVLRRLAILLEVVGAAFLIAFSNQIFRAMAVGVFALGAISAYSMRRLLKPLGLNLLLRALEWFGLVDTAT
jgi:O-antigen/teichoic acid export membrane protein